MADRRGREAERRAQLVGTTEAQAAVLRERLRSGLLCPTRLELAARCADPAARLVLGYCCDKHRAISTMRPRHTTGVWRSCDDDPFRPWVVSLSEFEGEALIRAATAGAWVALRAEFDRAVKFYAVPHNRLDAVERDERSTAGVVDDDTPEVTPLPSAWDALKPEARGHYAGELQPVLTVLEAVEAWLANPCDDLWDAWAEASEASAETTVPHPLAWFRDHELVDQIHNAAVVVGSDPSAATGEREVRQAIQRALILWALGESSSG